MSTKLLKPNIVGSVIRPAMKGSVDLMGLFSGIKKKIDPVFQKFIDQLNGKFSDSEREYLVFKTGPKTNSDDAILNFFWSDGCNSVPNEVYANLTFLNTDGRSLLDIPEGQDEVNFILGYWEETKEKQDTPAVQWVLYVEHEYEDGEREIHFHARPLNRWRGDFPKGFASQSKEVKHRKHPEFLS